MKTFSQFQEGVAALKVGSKLLPKIPSALKAVTAGTLTGLTLLQIKNDQEPAKPRARYKRSKSKTKKRQISDMEKKLTNRLDKQNLSGNRTGGETFNNSGLDTSRLTKDLKIKNGQVIQDEFSTPTNSTGTPVPGTGDDSSTVVVKKSSILRRRNYAKGGKNSRKPWLDHLKNKYT